MTTLRQAAEMALDALEIAYANDLSSRKNEYYSPAINALRRALAEPKQNCKTHPDAPHGFCRNASLSEDRYVCECEFWEPPQRQWVGLTDAEIIAEMPVTTFRPATTFARAIEAKLKEKNT